VRFFFVFFCLSAFVVGVGNCRRCLIVERRAKFS
jgi:hypothetical protein